MTPGSFILIIYYSYYTYIHMVPSMYNIQETSKSGLIQIARVYILSGSAEIISNWILR